MLSTSRKQSMRRRGAGWLALFAAALLLFAQSTAAAHYHPRAATHPSLATVTSAEAGPCALCLLACHFPGGASAAPAVMQPRPALNAALAATPDRALATTRSPAQSRAPPSVAL